MSTFLIVGKPFSGLRDKILSQGDDYLLLQDRLATRTPDKKVKKRVVADFSSVSSLLAAVDNLPIAVDGVITVYENYVLSTARIAEHLGLPGLPIAAAEACTDKFVMRQKFAHAPQKISPDYATVKNEQDLLDFAAAHSFPIILKPANLSKSLLVFKNHNLEELLNNYQRATQTIGAIYEKYAPSQTPKMLVEEFMEGPVHSVDAFVDKHGEPHVLEQVVDYQTGYEIGYDDNFHYSRIIPTKLSPEEKESLRTTAMAGCRALGMKSSPAHIEIIRTAEGPRVVEIGARNGGYRERMHRLANGIDIVENALRVALGETPEVTASKDEPCAVLELFPRTPGIFTGISHEAELRDLASLHYFAIKQPLGEHVGKSSDGYKMCAIIILHHHDLQQFQADLAFIDEHVAVQTT